MENNIKKEERTESVFIYVTPTVKKDFEAAKDNQSLKESIIKHYLQSETNWLSDELKQIDEVTIKYSAKLIGIREAFEKTQAAYVTEIENIYNDANKTFKKLDDVAVSVSNKISQTKNSLSSMLTQIAHIDFTKVDRLLSLVEKVSSMSNSELDLLKKLLNA